MNRLLNCVLQTPTYLTIGLGLLLVLYQQWLGALSPAVEFVWCGGLLLLTGIPHGALDHLIEKERSARRHVPFSMVLFMSKYIATIIIYGVGWLFFPIASLIIFLIISAWHFGETDIEKAPDTFGWRIARLVAGSFVLALILLTHADETTPILARIVQDNTQTLHVWNELASRTNAVLVGWWLLTLLLVGLAFAQQPIAVDSWRLGRLLILLGLTCLLPLLPAFMLYFGGWHALSSFGTIRSYLVNSHSSVWKIWRLSLPLTIAAVTFLTVTLVVWYRYANQLDILPVLFILISTITLPHIRVMTPLNSYNKSL